MRAKLLVGLLAAAVLLASAMGYRVWAVNANPTPGSIWTWFGPTFGADWGPAPPPGIPTPIQFGCKGDGASDDTACLQAAINSITQKAPSILSLGPYCYGIKSTITIPATITITGTGMGKRNNPTGCVSGIKALVANINMLLDITAPAFGTTLADFTITTAQPVLPNTSGIYIHNRSADVMVRRVSMFEPCVGISEGGNSNTYESNVVSNVYGANCVGVLVGAETNSSNTTDPRFVGNLIVGDPDVNTNGAKAGMEIQDSGGLIAEMNDILFFQTGTLIDPQTAGQVSIWGFFSNTTVGDTNNVHALVLKTSANTSIWGTRFTASWAASSKTGTDIVIDATAASSSITGIYFDALRLYPNATNNGMDIIPGANPYTQDIAIRNSSVCYSTANPNTGTGINLVNAGIYGLTIQNNRIGTCDRGVGSNVLAVGIALPTGSTGSGLFNITGNTIIGATTAIAWAPGGENAIVQDNFGLHGSPPAITAAATVNLPLNSIVNIQGTTAIQTLTGVYGNRAITIVPSTGSTWSFGSTGNICAPRPTVTAGVPLVMTWLGSCWAGK